MPEQERRPRVLIVSVNPLSRTSNNGKTIASFFEGYPKDSLAQLYFHRDIPSSDVCDSYFRISDEDVLRGVVRFSVPTGRRITRQDAVERVIPRSANDLLKKSATIRLLRSILWASTVRFDETALQAWLDDVRPEVIFFCGGDANYLYPKVQRLAQRYGAAIAYYITDDYVLPARTFNPARAINRMWTRRLFRDMCRTSGLVLTIGEKMSHIYRSRFGVESTSVMNLVPVPTPDVSSDAHDGPMVLSYVGSLHSNRWRVLEKLSASLARVATEDLRAEVRVYSQELPEPEILRRIDQRPWMTYCGSLGPDEVAHVIRSSDVLVHVEADDPKSKATTRLSISTKIPEYLVAGKPILAVGPPDVASIEYLTENHAAFVVATPTAEALDTELRRILSEPDLRAEVASRALQVARQNHDAAVLRPRLQAKICALADPREPPSSDPTR